MPPLWPSRSLDRWQEAFTAYSAVIARQGVAKLAVFAYNQRTGMAVWQSGAFPVASTAKDSWFLGNDKAVGKLNLVSLAKRVLKFGTKDDRLIDIIVGTILVVFRRVSEVQADDGLLQSQVQAEGRTK